MEAHNFFADHVHIGRPVAFQLLLVRRIVGAKANRGHVIGQRIEPDVDHVLGIAGHRNAPLERRAADRKIAQSAAHESDHFVAPGFRTNEVGIVRCSTSAGDLASPKA